MTMNTTYFLVFISTLLPEDLTQVLLAEASKALMF